MRLALTILAAIALVTISACGSGEKKEAPAGPPKKPQVALLLNWFPEAEHGGYYAASVEGIYARDGVEVDILPGGIDVSVVPRVAIGREQFGVCNADDLILGRAQGAKVVALMAPMQHTPRVIMVHEESGMRTLGDLKNMTLAMGIGAGFGQFVQKRYSLENVKIVPYPGSISVFLNDKNFGQQAYNISEPFLAKKNGGNPHLIFVGEAGYDPYTSILIVSESYLQENPEIVRKVVLASIEGWDLYMKSPAKTNLHINSVNPEMGMDILAFGVEEMKPLVFTPEVEKSGMGSMNSSRWEELVKVMEEVELIKPGAVPAAECYTTEFLPKKQ